MVTPEKIYNATSDGLDILALHYPAVRKAAATNKPFKMRPGEKTASASVKHYKSNTGAGVWKVTDFGGDGQLKDPIAIHMEETGLNFAKAIADLCSIFNIADEINRAVNRPDIRKQPATPEQIDGETYWDIDQEFTDAECKVMGPRVTPEHLKALHWYRVKCLISVKNREATYKFPNERYPIFMRECWFSNHGTQDRFYKIYEPLNADKQWRFQYQPKGKKPQSYVNGMFELARDWTELNEREEKIWNSNPENEGKPYKPVKIDNVIICSGERDAVCVKSLGYHPVWFNSETYRVSESEIREISRYADKIYNIPDIDPTGIKKGKELALRFIDIHTIWLPEELRRYRDNRGRPRKDFRDWIELNREIKDFRNLMEIATPAKFWQTEYSKDGKPKYSINMWYLRAFLSLNGIYVYKDRYEKEVTKLVKVTGHIVKRIYPREVRKFIIDWLTRTFQPVGVLNLALKATELTAAGLDTLEEIEPDFTNSTSSSQLFFFEKYIAEVKSDGIVRHDFGSGELDKYVWEDHLIPHDIKLQSDPFFTITSKEGSRLSEDYDIEVHRQDSCVFQYLINTSRLYWRKELEEWCDTLSPEEAESYKKDHKFDIAGPALDNAEIQEQKQCLISKIFLIGYLLHRHKRKDAAWAPYAMDNIIGENDQCNGRSGKSFILSAIGALVPVVNLNGRNAELLKNKHWLENVTRDTGVIFIDDLDEYFPLKELYNYITSDLTINPKNISSYQLNFYEAPKFALATNYAPREFNSSTTGRLLFNVFSDYYHQQSEENDYRESRSISDDFGMQLHDSDYPACCWEADLNFMMQCLKFYLSVSSHHSKIEPKMGNIIYRKHMREMGDNFRDWAETYFSPESGNLDVNIVRETAFEDYKRQSGLSKITMKGFTKSLKAFVYTCDYIQELNPQELCNSGSRILKRVGDLEGEKKMKEMIHLRTTEEFRKTHPVPIRSDADDIFGTDDPFS